MTKEFPGVMPWHVHGGDPWMSSDEAIEYASTLREILDERRKSNQRSGRRGGRR